ncbi:ESX secretion-associated protein EspG [Sciscionella marina]|uniref:ESX secretion-associated protein EspG n=1 Tax=Sciscionella marina TaxID=508770 RepID=UPI0003659360|nr:ESX secretion-associated protein EspG [Sciscionella marina]
MSRIQFPLHLSASTFALTWDFAEDVGELPTPLFALYEGTTDDEVLRSTVGAYQELFRGGAFDEAFANELERVYQALSGPPLEYYGYVAREDGTTFSVFVACHDRYAYLAVLDGDVVMINQVSPDYAAEALVSVLPEYPTGAFRSASAPASEVVGDSPQSNGSVMVPATANRSGDAGLLARLLRGSNPPGKGQLYVAMRNKHGRRQASEELTNYIDHAEYGRVMFYKTGPAESEYITARAGRPDNLAGRLYEVRDGLR